MRGALRYGRNKTADRTVALAGNPNVGKSTVFNALTGLNQHTGNWSGKTVDNAEGFFKSGEHIYRLVDLPGTYSLDPRSEEERVARDFIYFGDKDVQLVVCDATTLERGLKLLLQVMETGHKTVLCVNLMDEAARKGVSVDLELLSEILGVPTVGTSARRKNSLKALVEQLETGADGRRKEPALRYPAVIEQAVASLMPSVGRVTGERLDSRLVCLKLLEGDGELTEKLDRFLDGSLLADQGVLKALESARRLLSSAGLSEEGFRDTVAKVLDDTAKLICADCVRYKYERYSKVDRWLDRIFTGRYTAYPIILLMLTAIFFITITLSNYPSEWLSWVFSKGEVLLTAAFERLGAPDWLYGITVTGVYRVMTWVIAVMLPPMAIFFPLFTLMEDSGVLPRIAYDLDRPLAYCNACGKQALTMCMGFGCNAVGITGCRIIDSPRERLLGILTNSFVPCNGRFPTIIALISVFLAGASRGVGGSVVSALMLTAVIALGVLMTLAATKLLSVTVLKGAASSFVLEMPSYRRPQLGKVLVRSMLDRTLFVLGRAVAVAAPAGAILWLAANVTVDGTSILQYCALFLDPFAKLLGLDGIILMAFILGFPANEIVIPIIVMAYSGSGSITETGSLSELKILLVDNGWTWTTAVSTILFSLMHWPCSTSVLTVKKETGSLKWTAFSILLPTLFGCVICLLFNAIVKLLT